MEQSYHSSPEEVLKYFGTDRKTGLTPSKVKDHRLRYGCNELPKDPPTPLYELILEQFNDQLVMILLAAAFISFLLACFEEPGPGDQHSWITAFIEPIVILLILIANATVGVIQETNAEKAIEALKNYTPDEAKVLRDGHVHKIPSEDIVPGDIIEVNVGDKIPADLRLLEIKSSTLRIDQAILTGESISVRKTVEIVEDLKPVKQDQHNILFSGTTVTYGQAFAIAVQTGGLTAIGEIQKNISSLAVEKTPLKRRLDDFGDALAKYISAICILVWLINIRHFGEPSHGGWVKGAIYYFKIAVALAVAAIPEGLAVIITTCLALGTKRMARKNAIVRSLPSVETLGCTSVICSDKTGTLTTNRMTVTRFAVMENARGEMQEFLVSGNSFNPNGDILKNDIKLEHPVIDHPLLNDILLVCSLCNSSSIAYEPPSKGFICVGEPTEVALKVLVEKLMTKDEKFNLGLGNLSPENRATAVSDYIEMQWETQATLDFDRDRKSMSVYCLQRSTGKFFMFIKGAPENILERCVSIKVAENASAIPLTAAIKAQLSSQIRVYGEKHVLRVLAIAVVETPPPLTSFDLTRPENFSSYEQNMTFLGIVGMTDPPRAEVRDSIRKCQEAGIRVVVITGDNQATAESICKQIGLFGQDEPIRENGKSITGKQFDESSPGGQLEIVQRANLFSRTDPIHKCRLVECLKASGAIVAMTGDGVNDAPALKKADIGIAMGSGTDVAKLAADMVLADDDFATIVVAVEEGRTIYNNTKQFIRYLISSNIGEVVSIFLTVLLGMPEALIPVQLLWVNLVTDGLPATALGFNPPDHEVMKQKPRDATEPIVTRWLFFRYCVIGGYVGAATVFGYAWYYLYNPSGPLITWSQLSNFHICPSPILDGIDCSIFAPGGFHSKKATTMSLSVLVTIEMFNALNSLSENESLLTLPPWNNLYLIAAIALSMFLHFCILYIPFLATLFEIVALDWSEWQAVLYISVPVIIIDEGLKWISRNYLSRTERK